MANNDIFKYCGALHIHTNKSDGSGDLKEIIKSAKKANLSWIVITDHNYIDNVEGFIDGIYVIKGQEVSPKSENHYLVMGTNKLYSPYDDLQSNIDKIRQDGGFGFAAHPDESDKRRNNAKPIKWLDKNITPDGIEIWNWFSAWADNYDSRNFLNVVYSYLFRNKLVNKPNPETIKWWDELNNKSEKIVPAIFGVDAHALLIKKYLLPVKIFPYEFCFKTLVNEICLKEPLSKDFNKAKNQILNALKCANNIMINKQISQKSPNIYISNNEGVFTAGEKVKLDSNTYLNISLPKSAKIFVIKDGLEYNNTVGNALKIQLSIKGKYRIEIIYKDEGYIYTNPIVVE